MLLLKVLFVLLGLSLALALADAYTCLVQTAKTAVKF